MKKFKLLAHAFLVLFVALVISATLSSGPRAALAQSQSSPSDTVVCNSLALGATSAVVVTASTGSPLTIKALKATSSSATTLILQDGANGTAISILYLPANIPTELGPSFFAANGCKTTTSNGIYAVGTGTLSIQLVIGY